VIREEGAEGWKREMVGTGVGFRGLEERGLLREDGRDVGGGR